MTKLVWAKVCSLWLGLHMFIDIMELRTENKNSIVEKTVLIILSQRCVKVAKIVHKWHGTKKLIKFCNLQGNLHMFLDNIELLIKMKN